MDNYQIVLDDDLLLEYFKFKNGDECDTTTISRLFSYYKPHLTNVAQLERIKKGDSDLKQQLCSQGHILETLEELVQKTSFKLILSKNKSNYPFVDILKNNSEEEPIESNYTATFKNVDRTKAIEHIKALCQTAESIYICDKYISDKPNITDKIFDLFPKSKFSLFYEYDIEQSIISGWKKRNGLITIKNSNKRYKIHDRYLIIDQKIEIILTSGFEYLFSNDRDFTYIVRYT